MAYKSYPNTHTHTHHSPTHTTSHIIVYSSPGVTVCFVPPPPVVRENVVNAQVCIEISIGGLAPGEDAIVTISTSSGSARGE